MPVSKDEQEKNSPEEIENRRREERENRHRVVRYYDMRRNRRVQVVRPQRTNEEQTNAEEKQDLEPEIDR